MTNDEAFKTLREDYCGNRIICELYPDQCNREDCEIWLAIKALAEQPIRVLETQPVGDTISRQAAIDAILAVTGNSSVRELYEHVQEHGLSDMWSGGVNAAIDIIIALPSAQPDLCDGCDRYEVSCVGEGCGKLEIRLIDANALIHELNNSHYPGAPYVDAGISIAIGKVCDAPTIDPVKKGKWIEKPHVHGVAYCSLCDYELHTNDTNYCPNCGADMRGEQDK